MMCFCRTLTIYNIQALGIVFAIDGLGSPLGGQFYRKVILLILEDSYRIRLKEIRD